MHAYTQLIVAGLAGFIVGQTINAWVVVRDQGAHQGEAPVGPAGRLDVRRPTRRHAGVLRIAASAIGITTFNDFAVYTALGWFYKTAVEVVMLPITYRVIAYVKRHEPTYEPMCELWEL